MYKKCGPSTKGEGLKRPSPCPLLKGEGFNYTYVLTLIKGEKDCLIFRCPNWDI